MNRLHRPLVAGQIVAALQRVKASLIPVFALLAMSGCQTTPANDEWPNRKRVTLPISPLTTWTGVPETDPKPPTRMPATDVAFTATAFSHQIVGADLEIDFTFPADSIFPISDGTGMMLPDEAVFLITPSRTHARLVWKSAPKEVSTLLEALDPSITVSFDRAGKISGFQPGDNNGPNLIEIANYRKVPTTHPTRWNLRITEYRVYPWPTGNRKHYLTQALSFPSGIWSYGLYETGRPSSPFELIRFSVRESSEGVKILDYDGNGERIDEVYSAETESFNPSRTLESYVASRYSEDPPWLQFVSPGRPIAVIDQVEKGPGSDQSEMVQWVSSLPASEAFEVPIPNASKSPQRTPNANRPLKKGNEAKPGPEKPQSKAKTE